MKLIHVSLFLAAAMSLPAAGADSTRLVVDVSGIPPEARELMVVADFLVAPPEPTGDRPQRRRRAAPEPKFFRTVARATGESSQRLTLPVEAAENFRVRVAALAGDGPFRTVLAGAHMKAITVAANAETTVPLQLVPPVLTLDAANPRSVTAGATFTLSGSLTDPAGCLDGKGRMRVWATNGAPATEDFSGRQTSTIDVTQTDAAINFHIEVTAPTEATTLHLQFGELSPLFSGDDGSVAVFLAAPHVPTGAVQPTLRVEPAEVARSDG